MNSARPGRKIKHRLKYLKKTLKKKIAIYEPLEFRPTYKTLIKSIQEGEFSRVKKIPAHCRATWCLDFLLKDFLICQAYYALGEKYLRQRLMNRLAISDPKDIKFMEILDYILDRLERNGLEKIKNFKEKCKFKTFLGLAATHLLMDFWRAKYRENNSAVKYKADWEILFNPAVKDPLAILLHEDNEESREQAARVLPQILARLNPEEILLYKLKYEQGITKISAIARTLDRTAYKTRQAIKQMEFKIKKEIFAEIAPGLAVPASRCGQTGYKRKAVTARIVPGLAKPLIIAGGSHETP